VIVVDSALEKRHREGNPIRLGLVGAGYIGRGIAYQILKHVPGIHLAAIYNRTLSKAQWAYRDGGVHSPVRVESAAELEEVVRQGGHAVTDDPMVLCEAGGIDAIIEATGEVEFGARAALAAIRNGKHLVVMNAELDALVGPILKLHADRAGVVYTNADGDQPGVVMNLLRFVRSIGYRPILAGNIKGMLDPYRTPETQKKFAADHLQDVKMITSFADGTKLSFEQTVIANATGFPVARRGMLGPACDHVDDAAGLFPLDLMLREGLTDYVLGARPGPGVFVLGFDENPSRGQYMQVYKMGAGPVHVFYVPYHLPHLEPPLTVARAVIFGDAAVAPLGPPVCDVLTVAKRDLQAGEVIDGIGGFNCYGVIDNIEVSLRERLLPMGLAEKCRLKRSIAKDRAISYDDVEMPPGGLALALRREQEVHFFGATALPDPERAGETALKTGPA
jgi:predicted homoserine dehydrogenase-like protein